MLAAADFDPLRCRATRRAHRTRETPLTQQLHQPVIDMLRVLLPAIVAAGVSLLVRNARNVPTLDTAATRALMPDAAAPLNSTVESTPFPASCTPRPRIGAVRGVRPRPRSRRPVPELRAVVTQV